MVQMLSIKKKKSSFFIFLRKHPYLLTIPFLIVFWILVTNFGLVGKSLIASPSEVGNSLLKAIDKDSLRGEKVFLHAGATITRMLFGWGLAVILGGILGLMIGGLFILYMGAEPIIEFFRAIPPILAFPVFLVAFNYGDPAYIWTIVFGCLPIMALTVARGKQKVSKSKMEILEIYDAGKLIRIAASTMEVLPSWFLGARVTFSIALVIAVVTEMVFTPRAGIALGSLAKDAEISFDTPLFYACVVVIGVFGYLANFLMRKMEQKLGIKAYEEEN